MSRRVLVVEDDRDIAELVRMHLSDLPCEVQVAYDGAVALAEAQAGKLDLILLDLMLPGMNGIDVCRQLRAKAIHTPIIMLTSKSTEIDRVLGLEMGADDYLTKPFSIPELLARVKAIFRRVDNLSTTGAQAATQTIDAGRLRIDGEKRSVNLGGKPIELTAKEFDLLMHFARHPGRVYTRSELLDHVWGYTHSGYEHTVNSHINRLRAKIETDPNKPEFIQTVWGVGYKFGEDTHKPKA
jgi:DNA-binding response OmpR family regulator